MLCIVLFAFCKTLSVKKNKAIHFLLCLDLIRLKFNVTEKAGSFFLSLKSTYFFCTFLSVWDAIVILLKIKPFLKQNRTNYSSLS